MVNTPEPNRTDAIDAGRRFTIERARFVELLVSRRRLERVGRDATELYDRDTNETFVLVEESKTRHASAR
jgi:hypothetical protein